MPKYSILLINIFHLKIRSIRNKVDALFSLVSDFYTLYSSETHLDDNILIHGTIFREKKYRNCFRGRGTCLCFKLS